MHITSIRIQNYKCFLDSGEIKLSSGFNVIVGGNDAGKSALIEALSLQLRTSGSKPHRSLTTCPTPDSNLDTVSTVTVTYSLTKNDITNALLSVSDIFIPLRNDYRSDYINFFEKIKNDSEFIAIWKNSGPSQAWLKSIGRCESKNHIIATINATTKKENEETDLNPPSLSQGSRQDYGQRIAELLPLRTYAFRAERMNVGACKVRGTPYLEPNAENLPDVINQLSTTNPAKFKRYMNYVRTVFPHITEVTAPIIGTTEAKILIWNVPAESERADLAIPLSESGTGIGQVLAILYVIITADTPKVIIIDEPQSFLHPGAAKKLIEILRSHPQHQYIITTHSPIAFNNSDQVYLIKKNDYASHAVKIDPENQSELRLFLSEVGVRIGDVFGADSILWVEGKTEEVCFPELITRLADTPLLGTKILGVINTTELEAKLAERVYDIYSRLSGGASLLPPAIAFIFDKEGRSDGTQADINRKSNNLVRWLPRRMYENYLINENAISETINFHDKERKSLLTPQTIKDWVQKNGIHKKYLSTSDKTSIEINSAAWIEHIHGAKLLADIFSELTEQRIIYDKVRHGLFMTDYLIKNPNAEIKSLATYLASLIGRSMA